MNKFSVIRVNFGRLHTAPKQAHLIWLFLNRLWIIPIRITKDKAIALLLLMLLNKNQIRIDLYRIERKTGSPGGACELVIKWAEDVSSIEKLNVRTNANKNTIKKSGDGILTVWDGV